MFDENDHGYPSSFEVSQCFVALCFHDFYQFGNSKCLLGLWLKYAYIQCKRLSMWKTKGKFESVCIAKFD